MSTVLTLGTFDLPHPGHVALLRQCRKLAGRDGLVIAAVNSSAFVAKFKNRPPIMSEGERAAVIGAIRYVDQVLINLGSDQPALIESAKPDWIAVGADWAKRDYLAQLAISDDWLTERRISVAYLHHEESSTVSTTVLRQRREAADRITHEMLRPTS